MTEVMPYDHMVTETPMIAIDGQYSMMILVEELTVMAIRINGGP